MNALTFHHAKTQSEEYLEELHSQDPNPTDSHGESEAQDQAEQSPSSGAAKLTNLVNKALGYELNTK